ncbi:MAG TPA: hypothetical protein DEP05_08150 [Betaproteobacteria bacterium]|nr:hypothetical protein [Betaproteobacteria bacterium]
MSLNVAFSTASHPPRHDIKNDAGETAPVFFESRNGRRIWLSTKPEHARITAIAHRHGLAGRAAHRRIPRKASWPSNHPGSHRTEFSFIIPLALR